MRYLMVALALVACTAVYAEQPKGLSLVAYYDLNSRTRLDAALDYSIPLLADDSSFHPCLNIIGISSGWWGFGLSLPATEIVEPIFQVLKVSPSQSLTNALSVIEVGGAVSTTKGLNDFSGGLYVKMDVLKFYF